MFGFQLLIISSFLCCLKIQDINAACAYPYTSSDGNYLKTRERTLYKEKPFQTKSVTTFTMCSMIFMDDSKTLSMNVIRKSDAESECQLFENKADAEIGLISNDSATYYEKIEYWLKATSSPIHVKSKGEQPGTFVFQLPTGSYKIRLQHLSGGLVDNSNRPIELAFGGVETSTGEYIPNKVLLVKNFRGAKVVDKSKFTEWEGNGMNSRFLGTSKCFPLDQGSTYSFWYQTDHRDVGEADNYGQTSFEMFVQLCELGDDCI